jgi:hypothetical protein
VQTTAGTPCNAAPVRDLSRQPSQRPAEPSLLAFPATSTTDRGRVGSLDYAHIAKTAQSPPSRRIVCSDQSPARMPAAAFGPWFPSFNADVAVRHRTSAGFAAECGQSPMSGRPPGPVVAAAKDRNGRLRSAAGLGHWRRSQARAASPGFPQWLPFLPRGPCLEALASPSRSHLAPGRSCWPMVRLPAYLRPAATRGSRRSRAACLESGTSRPLRFGVPGQPVLSPGLGRQPRPPRRIASWLRARRLDAASPRVLPVRSRSVT